jgi:hypothetical protein
LDGHRVSAASVVKIVFYIIVSDRHFGSDVAIDQVPLGRARSDQLEVAVETEALLAERRPQGGSVQAIGGLDRVDLLLYFRVSDGELLVDDAFIDEKIDYFSISGRLGTPLFSYAGTREKRVELGPQGQGL